MQWNKFGLAVVGVLALSMGATSVASAERGGPEGAGAPGNSVDPATVCAAPAVAPGVAQLCTLWQGQTLPARAQEMIGRVIVRLAAPEPPVTPPATSGQTAMERVTAQCRQFLAKHPDATGPRAEFCQRVIAGTLTAEDLKRIEHRPGGERGDRRERPAGNTGPSGAPSTNRGPSGRGV